MNKNVRSYLIGIARKNQKFVTYSGLIKDCKLKIDLSTITGLNQLRTLLGEVSSFEDENNRPLISALVIYKDPKKNDHGDGFYKLAAQLGKGKVKQLKEDLWGFVEAQNCRDFWQDEQNYLHHYRLDSDDFSPTSNLSSFFQELMFDEKNRWIKGWRDNCWAFVKSVDQISSELNKDTRIQIDDENLYSGLRIEERSYESFMRRWLKDKDNGIASRGQSVLSEHHFQSIITNQEFKDIARDSICNPSRQMYDRLASWWFNQNMNNRPLLINRAFAALNPEKLSTVVHDEKFWRVALYLNERFGFQFEENPNRNWYVGNEQLVSWLDIHLADAIKDMTSDQLLGSILRNIFVWLVFEELRVSHNVLHDHITMRPKPAGLHAELPEITRSFKGHSKTDFEQKAQAQKDLGDAGEELVAKHEENVLRKNGQLKDAERVDIVEDGRGFDVLSFDTQGNPKYIEVKTTRGSAQSPFYLTDNEIAFLDQNRGSYCIYRLYNYVEETNSADCFVLNDHIRGQILLRPTTFQVTIKKT